MNGKKKEYWARVLTNTDAVSEEFKELMISMVSYDASERPSVEDIKNHKWMKNSRYIAKTTK